MPKIPETVIVNGFPSLSDGTLSCMSKSLISTAKFSVWLVNSAFGGNAYI